MLKFLRFQFWIETAMAVVTGSLSTVTMIWPDWIEEIFRVNPDHGDGSLEWLIVLILLAMTVTLFIMARYEWRMARSALYSKPSL